MFASLPPPSFFSCAVAYASYLLGTEVNHVHQVVRVHLLLPARVRELALRHDQVVHLELLRRALHDDLLHRALCHEAVHRHFALLPDAVRPVDRLQVHLRVPVAIHSRAPPHTCRR